MYIIPFRYIRVMSRLKRRAMKTSFGHRRFTMIRCAINFIIYQHMYNSTAVNQSDHIFMSDPHQHFWSQFQYTTYIYICNKTLLYAFPLMHRSVCCMCLFVSELIIGIKTPARLKLNLVTLTYLHEMLKYHNSFVLPFFSRQKEC